jgi:hypothetical protein
MCKNNRSQTQIDEDINNFMFFVNSQNEQIEQMIKVVRK